MFKWSSEWVKAKIQIGLSDGQTENPKADLFGVWAVHKTIGGSGWTVTHIPSGKRLHITKTKTNAKSLVNALIALDPKFRTADESYLRSKSGELLALIRDPSSWSVSKTTRKPKVSERRLEIARLLSNNGLRNLGNRYGKAGDFYGVKGSSRAIALGNREVLKNIFIASTSYSGARLQTRWGMEESELISRISDAQVVQWANWAKSGLSMVNIRQIAKENGHADGGIRKRASRDMKNRLNQMLRYAYNLPKGSIRRRELLRKVLAKKKHEKQFDDAKMLSKVDPALAKVMTTSGNTGSDKVKVKTYSGAASALKPSQTELIVAKSLGQALAMLDGKMPLTGDLGAIISKDNHIMDGHHRWAARILAKGDDATVTGMQADLPGEDLVRTLNILTKGAFGRNKGNKGKGNIKEFTPANVKKTLEKFLKEGIPGEFPWKPEDVENTLKKNFGSVEEGVKIMSDNAKKVVKKVPSWAVARHEMPVINEKDLPKTKKILEKGELDWNKPYKQASRNLTASERSALIKLASNLPKGNPERRELLRKVLAKKKHEKQFDDADKLSQVDPALAKVMTTSGNGGSDKIKVKTYSGTASALKPSQTELVPEKSVGQALAMIEGKLSLTGDLGAVISKDKYIMDGHHRWSARILVEGLNAKVKGMQADLPGEDLVRTLNILTKGAFGVNEGNTGEGKITDFTPSTLEKVLKKFVKEGIKKSKYNKFPWTAEEVKSALKKKFGSVEKGIKVMSENANLISKEVPSWAVKRHDMPVIDKKDLPRTKQIFEKGELDWNKPYKQASRNLTASERSTLVKLASGLPKGNPERRAILASLKKKIANSEVASTILSQMGGQRRLVMMIGANTFVRYSTPPGVSFKYPNRHKPSKGGNFVKITLNEGLDLYDMEFKYLRGYKARTVKTYSGVYADQLVDIFERQTGLYLRF